MSNKSRIAFGFHAGEPALTDGLGDFLKAMADSGQLVAAKSVDGTAGLMDYQKLIKGGAKGCAIYRCLHGDDVPPYSSDNFVGIAKLYMDKLNEHWPKELDKSLFYVELINEVDKLKADWVGKLCVELGRAMISAGYNFAGPAWSPGEPEKEHWETEGMLDYLRLCEQYPDRLAVSVHEYAYDNNMDKVRPFLMGRVTYLNEICDKHDIQKPDVFISEFGWSYNQAPSRGIGVPQIIDQMHWYNQHAPNVKALFLWALDKSEHWAHLAEEIRRYFERMPPAINAEDWGDSPVLPKHTPVPDVKPQVTVQESGVKRVIIKLAQEHPIKIWELAADYAERHYKRTMTASDDDMLRIMEAGNEESHVIIVDPERASQIKSVKLLDAHNYKHEVIYLEDSEPSQSANILAFWPTDSKRLTQHYGAHPEGYRKFGLPGHEGIDIGCPMGKPYYAVQDGEVIWTGNRTHARKISNYGYHVILQHEVNGLRFKTLYGHGREDIPVNVGDKVLAGAIIGHSGNTGHSSGPHCHFSLLWESDTGNGYPLWYWGQDVDPLPFLKGKVPPVHVHPKHGQQFHISDYVLGGKHQIEIRHPDGATESVEIQQSGSQYDLVKNRNYERLFLIGGFIWRGVDTSPGPAPDYSSRPGVNRLYVQSVVGESRAKWCPEHMSVGQTWVGKGHTVQFYFKDNCDADAANSGPATNKITFVAHHDRMTWNGITVADVVELLSGTGETFFFAKGYPMVAWKSSWGVSAISEVHDARESLKKDADCWSP